VRYGCAVALVPLLLAAGEDVTPRVGIVEIYGARKVSVQKIKAATAVNPGDPLPSRQDIEGRLDRIPGILASRVEAACCDQGQTILYVGVEEKDGPRIEFHAAPAQDITLSSELTETYQNFLDAVAASIRGRNADEDLTNGYSLMADPECRQLQQSFIPLVERDLALIDRVLRESSDADQRATAAYVMQYAPRGPRTSKTMVDSLQYALRDQDDSVRLNAMRSLEAVRIGAKLHPEQQIRIEPTWYIELMNSVVWSDRRNASLALVDLTEKRDPETLALLRQRALQSVLEMAQWRHLEDALPGFILAGRLAGLEEREIQDAWVGGDHMAVLKQALNGNRKKKSALD
jgi:hypothetical protein